jgi:hypothetical protein
VMIRRGYAGQVDHWVDRYLRRLDDLPTPLGPITDRDWPEAIGDGRRVMDWTAYFTRQLAEASWRSVLATWWPRLLPGVLAGTTHGVIRVGHVVRALLAGDENPQTLDELAHGLAFWAARYRGLPAAAHPAGRLPPGMALDALTRIPDQRGRVADRLGQLADLASWPHAVAALAPAADAEQARAQLTDLVTAATVRYLTHGHASPVLLVHTATAPNAVLHTLPALPPDLWAPSLTTMWVTTAALVAGYAPAAGPPAAPFRDVPDGPDAAAEVLDRAVRHGDEHVIKFTDTATEVYTRTGNRAALAAAVHISRLIDPVTAGD